MSPKNAAAVSLGRKGGHARAASMTKEERSDAARKAVQARWEKKLTNLEKKIEANPRKSKKKAASVG